MGFQQAAGSPEGEIEILVHGVIQHLQGNYQSFRRGELSQGRDGFPANPGMRIGYRPG